VNDTRLFYKGLGEIASELDVRKAKVGRPARLCLTTMRQGDACVIRRTLRIDAQSNLCYKNLDARQDYHFRSGGGRPGGGSHRVGRAILHSRQHTESKGLQGTLLPQYQLLCHVAKEYSSILTAVREEWFGIGHKHDIDACAFWRSSFRFTRDSITNQRWFCVGSAVAAATFAALHVSHLIQGP